MRNPVGQPVRLAEYSVPDFLIDAVDLDISLSPDATRVVSELTMRPNPRGRADAALRLDGDELSLVSLALDGVAVPPADYHAAPDALTLPRPPRGPFKLRIETRLAPAANTKLMGLYRSGSAYCTQCEAEGFRRITYFLDRPDVLSVYKVRLEANRAEAPVLLANGNLVESGAAGPDRHFAVWDDPFKKPCYLFAVVAGDLACLKDHFVTASGRRVALGVYTEPGKDARAVYAMDALKRSMAWDEQVYGREYDLDVFNIVAVSDFNMGAMENKGLNVFNDKYVLASPETATDDDYLGIEGVIAHEYFHNWTGNRITCRDWFQLCLKEGLTVFRDQDFTADQRSAPVKRIADVRTLRSAQFPEDAGPLAHNVRPEVYHEINNFYTATVYQKGAEVIRMLKTLIGADAYRKGMDLYFERCDGTAATVEEFLTCFADASGRDLTIFKRWYNQAGTPRLKIETAYDEAAKTLRVTLSQTVPPTPGQPDKLPMTIPVRLGLVDPQTGDLPLAAADASAAELASGVFALEAPSRTITFTNVARRPALSALRGFSAPVNVEDDLTDADRLVLLQRDSDSFNRWQALQTLALNWLKAATRAALDVPAAFVAAYGAVIADAEAGRIDPAFAALALNLPGEADVAREIAHDVDPDVIRAARERLRAALAHAHAEALARLHATTSHAGPFSSDAASAGRRSLRNGVLGMLVAAKGGEPAKAQYEQAENMTEKFGALVALASVPGEAREQAFDDFAQRYAAEPLILDKWLALQAQIGEADTLDRVRRLMRHPAFSFANPNRTRALIGGFAANPTQFNRADGAGYDFLADVVLQLDATNPQIAARLLTAMRSWQSLEPRRREKAYAALSRIGARENLSADVRDIVTRSTQGGRPA
jgi:aminopeptidase N